MYTHTHIYIYISIHVVSINEIKLKKYNIPMYTTQPLNKINIAINIPIQEIKIHETNTNIHTYIYTNTHT